MLRKRILKCWFGLPKSSFGWIKLVQQIIASPKNQHIASHHIQLSFVIILQSCYNRSVHLSACPYPMMIPIQSSVCFPNKDFGRSKKPFGEYFRSTFQRVEHKSCTRTLEKCFPQAETRPLSTNGICTKHRTGNGPASESQSQDDRMHFTRRRPLHDYDSRFA